MPAYISESVLFYSLHFIEAFFKDRSYEEMHLGFFQKLITYQVLDPKLDESNY